MSENKGLFALFGAVAAPKTTPIKKAEDIKTKEELAREAAFAAKQKKNDNEATVGGGAWKVAQRKTSRGLALKAKALGKNVTISENKHIIPDFDDGDVTMGGTGGKKKKRFSPYGNRNRSKAASSIKSANAIDQRVDVLITGFEVGTEAGIVPFLVHKSKKKWEPIDVKLNQGQMLITVNDPVIARILVRLDGYIYGTQQLRISLFNNPTLPMTSVVENNTKQSTMDILRNFLKSRWNSELKFLNLDDMGSDPILKKSAIKPPGAPGSSAIVGPAMMKLAGEMFANVVTVSFARNHLKNVQPISTLAQYLPNVQNLSFQDNLIKEYDSLEALSGTGKLRHLRELLLTGNPLRESEIKQRGNDRAYMRNIVKRFPSLVMLDGVPVQLSESEIANVHKTGRVLPLDNKPSFFDNEISQTTAIDFITKYHQLFDSDRSTLSHIYDHDAIFSVTSDIKLRPQQKLKRKDKKKLMEDEDKLTWTTLSRNLIGKSKRQEGKGLLIGPEAIGTALCRLPSTIHDLSKTEDFIVDAHQTPVGLLVSLHGEFKEDENSSPLSYSRTFLLRPATTDSPAMAAGWPYIIMSDMLCVRDYIGNQGFKPQAVITSIFASYPGV
ncbi:uncharacterized protein BX663DRAFT_507144 [Cokeromyces recurvatus]|uniref:uncharacterized protein n=1 Tax=Cokeromyces recurvatus TaxID=90255 RepID=UPI00221F6C8E|nr:uncharacterized protein BX663DRAFT_507144 [Cokeromyces recurvatus]KAI7903631.1 hypothetical protein BX663DRAFT_507144 [Cokeromyces recurvatus]